MKTVRENGMIIEFDCEVVMRDGTIIRYDVYRPDKEGQFPCITTYGPYSKGMHFSQGYSLFWHDIKEKYPEILKGTSGKYMNWETVDPEKWIPEETGAETLCTFAAIQKGIWRFLQKKNFWKYTGWSISLSFTPITAGQCSKHS